MKIILVDDEPLILEELEYLCGDVPGVEIVGSFTDPAAALECVKHKAVDFAFLDSWISPCPACRVWSCSTPSTGYSRIYRPPL